MIIYPKTPREIVGVLIIAALFAFIGLAHGHTLNATECHTFAWDAEQTAGDRAAGASYKSQYAELVTLLRACRERTPVTCIYMDDQDDTRAFADLSWIYDGEAAKMTPQQVHDRVESDCVAEVKRTENAEELDRLQEVHDLGVPAPEGH